MNQSKHPKKPNTRSKSEPTTKTLQQFYYDDKKIFHFLQKDEVASHRITQNHIKTDSYSILSKINSLFTIGDNSSYQKIKSENTKFFNDFIKAKNQQHLKPPNEAFKYLIKEYTEKDYKIPNLSLNHNIFKVTPLAEKNKDRLLATFTLGNDNKKKQKLTKNIMSYLRKIKEMVMEQMEYYKKKCVPHRFYNKTNIDILNTETSVRTTKGNSDNENMLLLNEIANLMIMIDECILDKLDEFYAGKHNRGCITTRSYKRESIDTEENDFNFIFPFTKKNLVLDFQANNKRKQSRNYNTEIPSGIKQLKKRTFDSMGMEHITNRSGLNSKTNTYYSDTKTRKPFFLCSPLPKRKNHIKPPSITSFHNQNTSPSTNKQIPFLVRSNTKQPVQHENTMQNNTKATSTIDNTFCRTTSTHFTTFKRGFGLGLTIRAKYKIKSDLVMFAYNKCKERDYASVRRAFRILLEKYRKMDFDQIEDYFEDVINNSDTNVILKGLDKAKNIVNKSNIEEKIRQMYSGENLTEKVKTKLDRLMEENKEINLLDRKFIKRVVKKK